MSVVIIGGNECMSRKYTDICQEHGCKAKVFPKETGPLEKKIGSPDLMILFTNTVSHKMIQGAMKAAKKNSVPVGFSGSCFFLSAVLFTLRLLRFPMQNDAY